MEEVTKLGILVFAAIAGTGAIASTAATPPPSCSSSPQVAFRVTQVENISDVYVDLYQVTAKGEALSWTGKTDAKGIARVPKLMAGKYRVFADSGTRTVENYLNVWNGLGAYAPHCYQQSKFENINAQTH